MGSCDLCMLAHLFGDYGQGTVELKLTPEAQVELGFYICDEEGFSTLGRYELLTEAWIVEIVRRREEGRKPLHKHAA